MIHRPEASNMRKNMVKHGNSMALVIEKPILELLGADAQTPFDIATDGQALVLTPVRDPERGDAFRAALERANSQYAEDLKKLAE
jgi:antitoxin MazE